MSRSRSSRLSLPRALVAVALGSVIAVPAAQARDARVIRDWRTPIAYRLELEPHLVLGTDPPGPGDGAGVGLGLRASFVILPEGFIRNVNDSVAVGVGFDFGHYYGSYHSDGPRDECVHFETAPDGTPVCTETTSYGGRYNYVYVPAVLQWNFWLTQRWSVFAEPGFSLYFYRHHAFEFAPAFYAGGRFLIRDGIAITGRLGYPASSIGVSFTL
jgi:hypothetical protein